MIWYHAYRVCINIVYYARVMCVCSTSLICKALPAGILPTHPSWCNDWLCGAFGQRPQCDWAWQIRSNSSIRTCQHVHGDRILLTCCFPAWSLLGQGGDSLGECQALHAFSGKSWRGEVRAVGEVSESWSADLYFFARHFPILINNNN